MRANRYLHIAVKQLIAETREPKGGVLMKNIKVFVVVLYVLCLAMVQSSCTATAQETMPQMSPEQMSPEEMKPYMEAMFKTFFEILASPEMAESMAKFYRNFYKALIKTGFTEDEALQIVISQGSVLGGGQQ